MIKHYEITLPPKTRGFHVITDIITKTLGSLPETALLNIFIQHTSAGLTINENSAKSVLNDFETCFNHLVPENESHYTHTEEGRDDMPAHIKSSLVGQSVTIPIASGRLMLGTWQGVYLCEFRNIGGPRNLILTLNS